MFTGFFSDDHVHDYNSALFADRSRYEIFFKLMLEEGVFFAPSPFEAAFLTLSHGEKELSKTIEAYKRVFKKLS